MITYCPFGMSFIALYTGSVDMRASIQLIRVWAGTEISDRLQLPYIISYSRKLYLQSEDGSQLASMHIALGLIPWTT